MLPKTFETFFLGLGMVLLAVLQIQLDFETERFKAVIFIRKLIDFCFVFTYEFRLISKPSMVMLLLDKLGLLNFKKLTGFRRYAILIVAIVSLILTPKPDIFNLTLMPVPLYFLLEAGIVGMHIWNKRIDT